LLQYFFLIIEAKFFYRISYALRVKRYRAGATSLRNSILSFCH